MENKTRVGNKWLEEEDNQLKKELEEYKLDYEDIANKHKRNIGGIKARIISHIIYPKYNDENIDLEYLSRYYDIDISRIHRYIKKIEMKSKDMNERINEDLNERINEDLNKRINERMKRIEDKLEKIIELLNKG